MRKKRAGQRITTLFVLLLGCIFALSVLSVLLLGVDVYKGISHGSLQGHRERTCLAYVAAKLRHADRLGGVKTGEFGGASAMLLSQELDGVEYVTAIYLWQGQLCELFYEKTLDLTPSDGSVVGQAESLTFELVKENLIRVVCDAGNGPVEMMLSIRSGEVLDGE